MGYEMRNPQIPYQQRGINTRSGKWRQDYLGAELLPLPSRKSLINLHLHRSQTDTLTFRSPSRPVVSAVESSLSSITGGRASCSNLILWGFRCSFWPPNTGKDEMRSHTFYKTTVHILHCRTGPRPTTLRLSVQEPATVSFGCSVCGRHPYGRWSARSALPHGSRGLLSQRRPRLATGLCGAAAHEATMAGRVQ